MTAAVKDVVVLLPGIAGSVLQKDGKDVWAPTPGAVLRGLLSLAGSLRRLELVDDDPEADSLGDGVSAPRLVGAAHLVPGLWKIDVYSGLERFLVAGLGLVPGENYFPFPYDWRRDNRASARLLQRRAEGWLQDWRRSSGADDARLVLVGHSMGGLVSRYYVEALGGWQHTRAVVTYGTPFYGSLNAVDYLVNGFRKGVGPLKADLTPMLRSLTSVHQLVPSYRCVQVDGAEAVTPADAGLPGWQPAWSQHVVEFQREMDEAAARNAQDPAYGTRYHPVVGRDQPTMQSAHLRDGTVRVVRDRGGQDESGDGTVPLLSAALSGTQDARSFAPDQHARLQCSVPLQTHLKGVLLGLGAPGIESLRAVDAWFGLDVDDVYLPDEPVQVEVEARSGLDPALLPQVPARLSVVDQATGEPVLQQDLSLAREAVRLDLGPLPPSSYLLTVEGREQDGGHGGATGEAAPVSDVFTVAGVEEGLG